MSDSLRDALVTIKAALDERSEEGEAHLFLNIPYWQLEELLAAHPAEVGVQPGEPVASRERIAEVLFAGDQEAAGSAWTWLEAGPLKKGAYLARADALLAAGVCR